MIAAALTALLLSVQPADDAAPGPLARSVALETAFPFWTDYLALPDDQRSAFTLDYVITVRSGAPARFWFERDDGFQPVSFEPGGAVQPPEPAAFQAGRRLFTDAPEGGASVSMRLSLPGPPRQTYALAELKLALGQAGAAMRDLMGLRALFMPRLDTVRFSFDGPAPEAVIVFADGREAPIESVYGDVVTVRPQSRALREAVEIRFAAPPVIAVLETGR